MNARQATANQLPAHVVAAVTSAAGKASRILAREYGVSVTTATLRAQGLAIATEQTNLAGGRHPLPERSEQLKEAMVVELTEQYVPIH